MKLLLLSNKLYIGACALQSEIHMLVYWRCHTGMDVCRGATPALQGTKYELVFRHSLVSFRHTKQNSIWQRGQMMFLQPVLSCSALLPQVGQSRMEGHSSTPWTWGREVVLQFLRSWRSRFTQLSLSQRSERGALPFHGIMHCQQKWKGFLLFTVQIVHRTLRLSNSSLST